MMTVGKMANGNIEQLGKATEIFFSPLLITIQLKS